MRMPTDTKQEALQDVWYGQIVTIVARWFVIAAALLLVLSSNEMESVQKGSFFLVVLIAANFFLHGRYLMGSPVRKQMVYAGSALDVAMISGMIAFGAFSDHAGVLSPFYVLYFPVVLAFALVFPMRATLVFTSIVLAAYTVLAFAVPPGIEILNGSAVIAGVFGIFTSNVMDPVTGLLIQKAGLVINEAVVMRLVAIATTAALATMYWRIQRDRRRSVNLGSTWAGAN